MTPRAGRPVRTIVAAAVLGASTVSACTPSAAPTTTITPPTTTTPAVTSTTTPVTQRATIVLVVPTTGSLVELGVEARDGLELAIKQATEDGRLPADLSVRVRVLDESARSIGRAVERATRDPNAIAIVGGLLPATEAVLAPIAKRRGVGLFVFSWTRSAEPPASVRIGPSADALVSIASRAMGPAGTSLAVVSAPGPAIGASASPDETRAAIVSALRATTDTAAVPITVVTAVPSNPTELGSTPLIVTGSSAASFALYARLRSQQLNSPPSLVVPIDAAGCRTNPTGVANGTRCVSRGSWRSTSLRARTFVEDTAAASILPSWATEAAYDTGGLIMAVAGASAMRANASATTSEGMRAALAVTKSTATYAGYRGIGGQLVPGTGFVDDAQVLRADGNEWVLDVASQSQQVSSPNTTSGASIMPATNGPNSP